MKLKIVNNIYILQRIVFINDILYHHYAFNKDRQNYRFVNKS